ncbi:SGNH/GDSL hydrolase family protein [Gordonia sp. ABSL1-1]|uniref:SGNH/GDSL hydrolase family protein n=1 Tax=Gordonia sp. ABSL1-1 TaxID=3053923 RepID=UPI0025746DF4|nr:SGNH/GDSL hydrolase family protein [Gordonia sp. ABSL1-1]MDL9936092.1 SGNH/GDSL hydrolase family protein [Gordonia sp. ABSL1-1]
MIGSRLTLGLSAALCVVGLLAGCADSDTASPPSTGTAASPTSVAPGVDYVNLGDSYSSGTGTHPLVAGSPFLCQRSSVNFAHVVATEKGLHLTDVSCAGADTDDLRAPQYEGVPAQFDALNSGTDIVTLLIGGNDNDTYGGAIRACRAVAPDDPTGSPCRDKYGRTLFAPIASKTLPSLQAALREIRRRAPAARVLIVGYPWILPATVGCYPTMQVAAGDVPYLRDLQRTLNDAVARAAADTGATFVDMSAVSDGHDACAGPEIRWIEPMTTSGVGAVHPNVAGQAAMAEQVVEHLSR